MTEDTLALMERIAQLAAEAIARDSRSIVADRMYSPDEAAELIGITSDRRGKTIREIDSRVLPIVQVTPGGRIVGYWGRDLLRYVEERRAASNRPLSRSA